MDFPFDCYCGLNPIDLSFLSILFMMIVCCSFALSSERVFFYVLIKLKFLLNTTYGYFFFLQKEKLLIAALNCSFYKQFHSKKTPLLIFKYKS